MEQHLSFTSHEFAQYLLRALQMFAVRRKAVQEALDREQAYYVRELIQWERLSDIFLLRDVHTPRKSAQDDGLDSGGSLRADNFAGWPVFAAPPGLQISRENGAGRSDARTDAYFAGRARRQRKRRWENKLRQYLLKLSAQSGQNASYQ